MRQFFSKPLAYSASLALFTFMLPACSSSAQNTQDMQEKEQNLSAEKRMVNVTADVWVDNWFELSVNGGTVLTDSTPFKTERSFNGDRGIFDMTLPAIIALEFRDYYENDTGLEYIGNRRQQLGDGGGIAQIVDNATGQALFVTNEDLRCTITHRAPLDHACQFESKPILGQGPCQADIVPEPEGWRDADFDDSDWFAPTIHSAAAVRPRRDYDQVDWDSEARLIWGPDLEVDNIILCRAHIDG